ncbi:MAG: hypothetical protein H6R01_537 [Burkholderiaceae bacterium]|nr:hypothetical protein [Burkholderiaceae bacterium]
MQIDNLLSRLDKVRQTGKGTWMAGCPAHDDRSPSLSIRETEDGRILLHCFSGCDVWEIVSALGLEMDALFPPKESIQFSNKPERRPFPASDVLQAIAFEALVVASAGAALMAGQVFTTTDRERLILAVSRIQSAVSAAMPNFSRRDHV